MAVKQITIWKTAKKLSEKLDKIGLQYMFQEA
jgi:hypothetical protein